MLQNSTGFVGDEMQLDPNDFPMTFAFFTHKKASYQLRNKARKGEPLEGDLGRFWDHVQHGHAVLPKLYKLTFGVHLYALYRDRFPIYPSIFWRTLKEVYGSIWWSVAYSPWSRSLDFFKPEKKDTYSYYSTPLVDNLFAFWVNALIEDPFAYRKAYTEAKKDKTRDFAPFVHTSRHTLHNVFAYSMWMGGSQGKTHRNAYLYLHDLCDRNGWIRWI